MVSSVSCSHMCSAVLEVTSKPVTSSGREDCEVQYLLVTGNLIRLSLHNVTAVHFQVFKYSLFNSYTVSWLCTVLELCPVNVLETE